MIPKTQCFNALLRQKFFPRRIALDALWQTVLKPVQFDVQLGVGAIKIQNKFTEGMLATEFESGETMIPQRAPELLFLVGLFAAKPAGCLD